MNKKQLTERDICTKYIAPALERAGWDIATQVREEFSLTKGRIIVRGKLHTQAQHKRVDYVLFYKPNIPLASVKDLNVDIYLEKTIDFITNEGLENSSANFIPSGSIIVCTRMGLGKICINNVDIAINQALKALTVSSNVDKMFFFKKYLNYDIKGQGVTVKGIRQDELLCLFFPLPPLAEQHRIVARIDQLMARCDELEKLRAEPDQKQTALLNALMAMI
jgi:type I restriction enzyme, S subunit